jgi:hypothetical protein
MVDAPERTGIRLGSSSGVPEVGARVVFGESVKPCEGHGPSPVTSEENSLPKPCSIASRAAARAASGTLSKPLLRA